MSVSVKFPVENDYGLTQIKSSSVYIKNNNSNYYFYIGSDNVYDIPLFDTNAAVILNYPDGYISLQPEIGTRYGRIYNSDNNGNDVSITPFEITFKKFSFLPGEYSILNVYETLSAVPATYVSKSSIITDISSHKTSQEPPATSAVVSYLSDLQIVTVDDLDDFLTIEDVVTHIDETAATFGPVSDTAVIDYVGQKQFISKDSLDTTLTGKEMSTNAPQSKAVLEYTDNHYIEKTGDRDITGIFVNTGGRMTYQNSSNPNINTTASFDKLSVQNETYSGELTPNTFTFNGTYTDGTKTVNTGILGRYSLDINNKNTLTYTGIHSGEIYGDIDFCIKGPGLLVPGSDSDFIRDGEIHFMSSKGNCDITLSGHSIYDALFPEFVIQETNDRPISSSAVYKVTTLNDMSFSAGSDILSASSVYDFDIMCLGPYWARRIGNILKNITLQVPFDNLEIHELYGKTVRLQVSDSYNFSSDHIYSSTNTVAVTTGGQVLDFNFDIVFDRGLPGYEKFNDMRAIFLRFVDTNGEPVKASLIATNYFNSQYKIEKEALSYSYDDTVYFDSTRISRIYKFDADGQEIKSETYYKNPFVTVNSKSYIKNELDKKLDVKSIWKTDTITGTTTHKTIANMAYYVVNGNNKLILDKDSTLDTYGLLECRICVANTGNTARELSDYLTITGGRWSSEEILPGYAYILNVTQFGQNNIYVEIYRKLPLQ